MVSFVTNSKALAFCTMISSGLLASAANLRSQSQRQLQGGFCDSLGFNIPLFCPQEEEPQCPMVSPLNATQFDLDKYIEKSWYIQKQQTNPYQSENQLYCVVATYSKTDTEFIDVKNYGNSGQVNGPAQNSDNNGFFSTLCAKQYDAGELGVAPCFLSLIFDFASGPYWVLAVADDYSWAIVSGGQPDQPYQAEDGSTVCTTKEGNSFFDTNGSGLWLFTREQVAPAATIQAMETKLQEMGVYTGLLKNVSQEGCVYEGATLKV